MGWGGQVESLACGSHALAHDAVIGSRKLELQVEIDLILGRSGEVDHMQHPLGRKLRARLEGSVIQPAIAQCLVPTLALCGRCLRKQLEDRAKGRKHRRRRARVRT